MSDDDASATGSAVPHEIVCPQCVLGAHLAEHAGNAPHLAPPAFPDPDPYEDTHWAQFFAQGGNQPRSRMDGLGHNDRS